MDLISRAYELSFYPIETNIFNINKNIFIKIINELNIDCLKALRLLNIELAHNPILSMCLLRQSIFYIHKDICLPDLKDNFFFQFMQNIDILEKDNDASNIILHLNKRTLFKRLTISTYHPRKSVWGKCYNIILPKISAIF